MFYSRPAKRRQQNDVELETAPAARTDRGRVPTPADDSGKRTQRLVRPEVSPENLFGEEPSPTEGKAFDDMREPTPADVVPGRVPPRVPNDEAFIPDPRRDQAMPSFDDPLPQEAPPQRTPRYTDQADRYEREKRRREKQNRQGARRSRSTANTSESKWPADDSDDPNGPDSWYRPGQPTSPAILSQSPGAWPQQAPIAYPENVASPMASDAPPMAGAPTYQHVPVNAGEGIYQGVMSGDQLIAAQPASYVAGCPPRQPCDPVMSSSVCCDPTFYLSMFGGWSDLDALDITDSDGLNSQLQVSDGFGLGAAIGQFQGQNLRTEIEFSYRRHQADRLNLVGNPSFPTPLAVDGEIESFSGLANASWEFTGIASDRFAPYVGAGIGFTSVDTDLTQNGSNIISNEGASDSGFAYQFIGGLNYRAAADIEWFVEYRLFKADSLRMETTGVNATPPNGTGSYDYHSDNLFAGLRFRF